MVKNSQTICLNQKNVVAGSSNAKYEYQFKFPTKLENQEIALASLSMYYSWYNLNKSLYNNTLIQYRWIDNVVYNIEFPDGKYQLSDINKYIQYIMANNNHYTTDANNNKTFYFEFDENPPYYCFQLNMTPIQSVAQTLNGTGAQIIFKAAGADWDFPTTPQTFQFLFPTTSNFNKILGFNQGYTPSTPQNAIWSPNSDFTPILTPCNSIVMRCNLVNSDYALPNDILFTFTQGETPFGSLFEIRPPYMIFTPIANGTYPSISITFTDQNYLPVQIIDSQLLITLIIQDRQ
jgi:hypothetical protein